MSDETNLREVSEGSQAAERVAAARAWDGVAWPESIPDHMASLVPQRCDDPVATVLIPCRDDGGFLIDALASVQVCVAAGERLETIVIDDASSDPLTVRMLDIVAGAGVRVVTSQARGPACARNTGLGVGGADTIVPLDADNLLRAGYVPRALEVMAADDKVAAVHAAVNRFGLDHGVVAAPTPSIADLLCGNKLDTCAVIRRAALDEVGGWDEAVNASEDWALWVALVDAGWKLDTIPLVGSDYRVRTGSLRSILDPTSRYEHLLHLIEGHGSLYAAHAREVIIAFAGRVADLERSMTLSAIGDHDQDPEFADLLGELTAQRDELRDELEAANRAVARAETALDGAVTGADELEVALDRITRERDAARRQLDALEHTKLFTWARLPRSLYGRARGDRADR